MKALSDYRVQAGDPITVTITIFGCSGVADMAVPFDGVILIDNSGSMSDNDPDDKRITESIFFSNQVSDQTRLAIVTFDDSAHHILGLTSDKTLRANELIDLRGTEGGETNMYDGIEMAQQILADGGSPNREWFIIILTDGIETSYETELEYRETLAGDAVDLGITYYAVILIEEDAIGLVTDFTDLTGGDFFFIDDIDLLHRDLGEIGQEISYRIQTRDICLHEKIGPEVRVVPDSVITNIESVTPEMEEIFCITGEIDAFIGSMDETVSKNFIFEIFSTVPGPYDEEEIVLVASDDSTSVVSYIWDSPTTEETVQVPIKYFESIRPPVLVVKKYYDKDTSTLTISLENSFSTQMPEMVLRDIALIEIPNLHFQPDLDSAEPALDYSFPGPIEDIIVWLVPEIGPSETKTFQINLDVLVVEQLYNPPVPVDKHWTQNWGYLSEDWFDAARRGGAAPSQYNDAETLSPPSVSDYYSMVLYRLPNGTMTATAVPQVQEELPNVEDILGRVNRWINPAYNFSEWIDPDAYRYTNRPVGDILYLHDSEDIWVDSLQGNGYWNYINSNTEDFIRGADGIITVNGQGDFFDINSNNKIMAKVKQGMTSPDDPQTSYLPGEIWAGSTPNGANLYGFNYATRVWDFLENSDVPSIQPSNNDLIVFEVEPGDITPDHTTWYAIPKYEVVPFIRRLDFPLSDAIEQWIANHPQRWMSMGENEYILPSEVARALPEWSFADLLNPLNWFRPSLKEQFITFLNTHIGHIAWGRECIEVKVEILPSGDEKHTNNNNSTEKLLIGINDTQDSGFEIEEIPNPPLPSWTILTIIIVIIAVVGVYWRKRIIGRIF